MVALPSQTTELSAQDTLEAAGWSAATLIVLGIFSIVACLTLLASLVNNLRYRRRVKDVEAELGIQQDRAVSLEREVNRRDAFIDRNVLNGPDAYSAASPAGCPRESASSRPDEVHADLFVVGSDDESSGSDSDSGDDNDSRRAWWVETLEGGSADTPLSPTPVPAVRVRRSQIKTIDLPPKTLQNQPRKDVQVGLEHNILQNEESQINRYWDVHTVDSPPRKAPS